MRYRTNDTSYEALAELIAHNPTGILVERDELVSLLRHLDRNDQAVARGFFLSGWSGTQPYTLDRISRGTRHIEAVCISVLGNSQPARIAEYAKRANSNANGGDGLLQRFGLMAWPDTSPEWEDMDRYPHSRAREDAWEVFARLEIEDGLGLGLPTEIRSKERERFQIEVSVREPEKWRASIRRQNARRGSRARFCDRDGCT